MNQLSAETSPYLLQHADNPVDWHPWCEGALALARKLDKPVLLSIGYSACHWCHVMAHESFEDTQTADLMNRLYVNIKVDREERPDLDKVYQQAHSALNRRPGGWPLTVFLNPHDLMPIFAGTYFPPQPRHGLPSFRQLLLQIDEIYRNRRDDIEQQSLSLRAFFEQGAQPAPRQQALTSMPLDMAASQIRQQFDRRNGGFSPAPKFPHPAIIHFALHDRQRDAQVRHAALFTLKKICEGGIADHIGGGFFRYSTDNQWVIPHFEKMLYDNGPLLALTTQAWCLDGCEQYRRSASATAEWVMREMQSAEGGYFSAQDADSEGEEGRFYVWDKAELQQHVPPSHWPPFSQHFCLDQPANFDGKWHLHICCDQQALAKRHNMTEKQIRRQLQHDCRRLLEAREQRPRPGLDDKILTAWNALMIQAMAYAGRQLQQPQYIMSARRALAFIHKTLWRNTQLYAATRNGDTRLKGYLDDYAFLLHALLELLQCEWRPHWLQWASELADSLLEQFEDSKHGGFYFTSYHHEQLITRSKSFADEAIPAGNGIATLALQRLGWLTGNTRYLQAADNALHAAWSSIELNTIAHCTMLEALHEHLKPPDMVMVRGQQAALHSWRDTAPTHIADTLLFYCPQHDNEPDWLAAKRPTNQVGAFVCNGMSCSKELTCLDDFHQWIEQKSSKIG